MRKSSYNAALAGLLLLASRQAVPAPAPGPDEQVAAIIAKAVAAKGGEAALRKYRACSAAFTGSFHRDSDRIPFSGASREQAPDKEVIRVTIGEGEVRRSVVTVFDGDKGWESLN